MRTINRKTKNKKFGRRLIYNWRASRNLSCSSSVQLSLDLVIVYGFLTFFPEPLAAAVAEAAGGVEEDGACELGTLELIVLVHKQKKTQLRLQEGFVDASPYPVLVFAPLPCRSAVQSKRGIAQSESSNGKRRETVEMIVGSCISRAVAFSSYQFKAILKSFSDLSARKNTSFGDFRCQNAGKKHPNGPIDNGNGDGGNGGEGGGGGSESGSPGDGGGSNPPLMGPVWKRAQKSSTTRGRTILIRAANRRQIYDHATAAGSGGSRVWLWVAEATVARALMEPAVVDGMLQAMLMPFQAFFFLMSPEFGNQIVQFMMVVFVVGPLIAIVLLWLIWRWWRAKKAQGNDAEDDDGEGHKQDDGDRE